MGLITEGSASSTTITPDDAQAWQINPFLHVDPDLIYNPLSDSAIFPGQPGYIELRDLLESRTQTQQLSQSLMQQYIQERWLVADESTAAQQFHLKYVSLEAHSICNQGCYFCPVSTDPRDAEFMPTETYEHIVEQLSDYRSTILAVFMNNYNEPTVDKRFVDQVRMIKQHGLPPAVLTNGTGLTPDRIDQIVEMGGLRYMSINLSTMNRERYKNDRQRDHLDLVLRNATYAMNKPVAQQMDIIVLGLDDQVHNEEHEEITRYFAGSRFNVRAFPFRDRAGYLPMGLTNRGTGKRLAGCTHMESRPFNHLHITAQGRCLLCCEDYDENYVVGDLRTQTVADVLTGPEMARIRRQVYGLEDSPENFICHKCYFARKRD